MKFCVKCERSYADDRLLKIHHTRVHPLSDSLTLDFLNMDRIAQSGVMQQALDKNLLTGGELDTLTMAVMRGDDPHLMAQVRKAMTHIRGIEYRYVIAEIP